MNFAVPLSFITQVRPDDVGQPEGIHIPRAPGRTFRTARQDGFQPAAVPLLAKLWCVLFPINALFGSVNSSRNFPACQVIWSKGEAPRPKTRDFSWGGQIAG